MFPEKTITINIDGKDYQSEQGVFYHATGVAHDKTMFESVEKDWGSLTGFILDMAELWLVQMKRTECQVTYNHGNGSIAIGKHGIHPSTPDPYEDEDSDTLYCPHCTSADIIGGGTEPFRCTDCHEIFNFCLSKSRL